ncbi:MAG: anaerobic ribonucleoside-triphosphate reductase [Desulfuromonadaceae bacterium]|nr:anaerobic ribonucleoside-triphosphate reductase [Desulfuromonadaceae bacterium]
MKETTMKTTIDNAERQQCEVWTRVMGYHRPVASFNTGKKSEHRQRRFFTVPDDFVYPC